MKRALSGLALLAVLAAGSPAAADAAGAWRVEGKVSGVAFTLDCRFEPQGAQLGGVCVEVGAGNPNGHAGAVHHLTKGSVDGNQVSWTYPSSAMLFKFDVTFTGTLDGARMAGTIVAAGRKGDFTGVKS
jgi:hypothetical protein